MMLTRERIKIILEETPLETTEPDKIQKWMEQVLFHVLLEEGLSMNEKFHEKADKIDIKVLIERSDEKFAAIQKEINIRFEALQKEMNTRFEAVEKRFNTLQWTIGLGFSFITILISVLIAILKIF